MQRRQDHGSSQSKSELFSKHAEDDAAASGFSIEQPIIPKDSKDATKRLKRSPPLRGSYSGPLVASGGPTRSRGKYKDVPSQPTKYQAGKLSESAQEFMRHQNMAGACQIGSGRATNMGGERYKGNKIHFSGPMILSNVDQMIRDDDRHIQEAAYRARLDKTRLTQVEAEMTRKAVYPCSRLAK